MKRIFLSFFNKIKIKIDLHVMYDYIIHYLRYLLQVIMSRDVSVVANG